MIKSNGIVSRHGKGMLVLTASNSQQSVHFHGLGGVEGRDEAFVWLFARQNDALVKD